MQCLINYDNALPEKKVEAKMDLILKTNELMPKGIANLTAVVKYPKIADLVVSEGRKKMLAVIVLLVKDFCGSVNVVRNMNQEQMIEAGLMLLDECGNFRLEDYVMMFSMAKKGQFPVVKIWDRMDIQIVTAIVDAYWTRRKEAGEKATEEDFVIIEKIVEENPIDRKNIVWDEVRGYIEVATKEDKIMNVAAAFGAMKEVLIYRGLIKTAPIEDAKKQIIVNPNYVNNWDVSNNKITTVEEPK